RYIIALHTIPLYSFFFSSRRRHTRWPRDWSSDVCSSDLTTPDGGGSIGTRSVESIRASGRRIWLVFGTQRDIHDHPGYRRRRLRSEERRVGKECRSGVGAYEEKGKKDASGRGLIEVSCVS